MFGRISMAAVLLATACGGPPATPDYGNKYRVSDVVVSPSGTAQCGSLPADQVAQALRLTNAKRASGGMPPLRIDPKLMQIAARHSCFQAGSGVMSHAGPKSEGPKDRAKSVGYAPRVIAENIASGPYSTSQAVNAWNASPSHLGNIMIPQVSDFGIGSAIGPNGYVYWTGVYADKI